MGEFYRNAGLKLDKFEALQCCVTPDGTLVDQAFGRVGLDLQNVLERWQALPEAKRVPSPVASQDDGVASGDSLVVAPPAGGLILKVHVRALMNGDDGRLRYMAGRDLWFGDRGGTSLEAEFEEGRSAAHEAQPHHMWLTEAEWKSLIPTAPREGDTVPLPSGVVARIIRWHLNPLRFYGRYETDALERREVRASKLKMTVDAVATDAVRLRLDGFARLGTEPPAAVANGTEACLDQWGYEPRILGFLEYDPRSQSITRFDIVALGDHFGRLGLGRRAPSRIGLQPLGIAFQMVKGDQPADRVPPGRPSDSLTYFNLSE